MSEELKPCPFCGGVGVSVNEGSTFRWRYATCDECGAQAPEVRIQTLGGGTRDEWETIAKADAIDEWNRRAQDAELAALRTKLEEAELSLHASRHVAQLERTRAIEAERKLAMYEKAAPLCAQHQPTGGCRSGCVVCSGEKLQHALSRISYTCELPNEMEVSAYDVHYNEDAVVEQVQRRLAQARAEGMEEAAKVCAEDESGRDSGGYFAEIIRAKMKEQK